jgi:cyanophycin synthetase
MSAKDIPITFGGKALHNIANVLPAALACYLFQDITIEDIRQALQTFIPSTSQTPGRLNFFQMKNSTFLVDFAHNPHGLKLLGDFVNNLDYPHKTGIITGTGDRRDEDIRELGELSAHYFDDIIIRLDKNLRGRPGEEIIDLLHSGVKSVDPNLPVTIIEDEDEAIHYAYTNAPPGTLVTLMCDGVSSTLEKIKQLKLKEEQGSEKGKVDDLSSINA